MTDMLKWNPGKRPSAQQALRYPYFSQAQILPHDAGNGTLVQQTIQQSYARQNGAIPQDGLQNRGQRSYSEPRGISTRLTIYVDLITNFYTNNKIKVLYKGNKTN